LEGGVSKLFSEDMRVWTGKGDSLRISGIRKVAGKGGDEKKKRKMEKKHKGEGGILSSRTVGLHTSLRLGTDMVKSSGRRGVLGGAPLSAKKLMGGRRKGFSNDQNVQSAGLQRGGGKTARPGLR